MFFDRYPWQIVTVPQMEPLLKQINSVQDKHVASPTSATVEWCHLTFYKSVTLVRVNDSAWAPNIGPFWFLAKDNKTMLLDGSSTPIHDANAADSVKLTEKTALDYLFFFCYFVHGDDGPFLIVEDLNHPALDRNKLDDSLRKEVEGKLRRATFEGKTPGGALRASATVLYGTVLFFAQFSMEENGEIEMTDDEPLVAELPIKKLKPNY